ncbi:hypothetical protein J437_LFUL011725 [Ladona fulva]|uniref:H/ACA ribonucleoprotein complex subunit 3 n=1 Tax=Ladona fulva TaxID=123851 RepID=A0A8K0P3M5_LADFU|nr:hypothetical protein J437_LFUL011725 [Ladona fulva]
MTALLPPRGLLTLCAYCKMYLMYFVNESGDRVYTLKKLDREGKPTMSAHPARFSPEDKYSKHRVAVKRRFNLLPIQQEPIKY